MQKPNFEKAKDRTKVSIKYKDLKLNLEKVVDGKKYFIRTYGCQMNVHDSEQIKFYLSALGYSETNNLDEADVVILNTCAIRENAKDKLFGFLSRAKHLKTTIKPDLVIVLAGCLMQVEGEVDFVESKHKYVDIVIGTHNIDDLPKYLNNRDLKQKINVPSNSEEIKLSIPYKRDSKYTAFVNITFGCDNFCTYCIVPFARGRERSREKDDILNEVNNLIKDGYKEIILLGQNVNSYGKDFEYEYEFKDLLLDVAKTKIERIRFVTSNPWNFSDGVIKAIKENKNIMPYVHLPMQSGSNKILKSMNRKNTVEEYKVLFDKIKKHIPGVSITTDIIVGFPGETETEFKETMELAEYCKFDGAFTFIYSPREGTIAAKMEDLTLEVEKNDRLKRLNTLINKYSLENNKKLKNRIVSVLVMGVSEKDANKAYGYTDTMKLVNIEGGLPFIGQIINVKINETKSFSLDGTIIDNN